MPCRVQAGRRVSGAAALPAPIAAPQHHLRARMKLLQAAPAPRQARLFTRQTPAPRARPQGASPRATHIDTGITGATARPARPQAADTPRWAAGSPVPAPAAPPPTPCRHSLAHRAAAPPLALQT